MASKDDPGIEILKAELGLPRRRWMWTLWSRRRANQPRCFRILRLARAFCDRNGHSLATSAL
jgi:hypothetical protein